MAQPRGYNPEKHSALPYVDKQYKDMVNEIAEYTGLSKKKTTEKAITELHKLIKSA